jgi:DNA-3-methyladenine glycosylase
MGQRVDVVLTPLPRQFYDRPVVDVARGLLGAVLESALGGELVRIRLTEVEAYGGMADPASHAFRGPSARNRTMFGPPGRAYVYFTYGMHFCMNLVTGAAGTASAVLLRAGTVIDGADVVARRRPGVRLRDYARGPARLTKALNVDRAADGEDVCTADGPLRVLPGVGVADQTIRCGPRVGVAVAGDVPWRFWLADEASVSPYRPGGLRRGRGSTRV